MLFGEVGTLSGLFATHPPLPERIRALGARFDEAELEAIALAWAQPRRAGGEDVADASLAGFAPSGVSARHAPAATAAMPGPTRTLQLDARRVASDVGRPHADDMAAAGVLLRHIPERLETEAHDPQRAVALMVALTLETDDALRDAQLLRVDAAMGSAVAEAAESIHAELVDLHPMLRLPLAALAFPVLKRRPRPQLDRLLATMDELVRIDDRVSLHEFCLMLWLHAQLQQALDPAHGFVSGALRLTQCVDAYASLCAVVSAQGHDDDEAARRAYLQAMREALPDATRPYAPPRDWQPALEQALQRLNRLAPRSKELVIRGLVRAVAADGTVTVAEAELLRLVCAVLHCPLPSLVREVTPQPQ